MTTENNNTEIKYDEVLLHASIKLNTRLLAVVFGLLSGTALMLVTYMSLYRGLPDTGQYLRLLGVFLPGYEVTPLGAWIGFFWGALIGAFLAAMFYRIYARSIPEMIKDYLNSDSQNDDLLDMPLRLSGHYLGLALGTVIALGLVVTTNWLVIRGTADESTHAQLLVNYLPGYSVSTLGSIIGAVELFIINYVLSLLFSWIYNTVTDFRGAK